MAAPLALILGVVLALVFEPAWAARTKKLQTLLLQGSVVALGAGMDLGVLLRASLAGLGYTFAGLVVTFALTYALSRLLRTDTITSLLIGTGTAICGGSAIAATAPAIGARSHQTGVALAVVFLLNGVALLIFPPLGHAFGLSQAQFGLWAALAIHDTSSVVGAALQFGPEALALATTVKLARALWIFPVAAVQSRLFSNQGGAGTRSVPWFLLAFLAMAALVTFVPSLRALGQELAASARWGLVASLFLVGLGISRAALKRVGLRPLLLGVSLWALVSAGSLLLVLAGGRG